MQYGVLVISTSLTGSQKPIETPGIGIGGVPLLHMHNGDAGFFVSRFFGAEPLPIFIPVGGVPIEIGNKQL